MLVHGVPRMMASAIGATTAGIIWVHVTMVVSITASSVVYWVCSLNPVNVAWRRNIAQQSCSEVVILADWMACWASCLVLIPWNAAAILFSKVNQVFRKCWLLVNQSEASPSRRSEV